MTFLIIDALIQVLTIAIFVRVLLSWFQVGPDNPIASFVYEITEPMLAPFKRFATVGAFDLSPIIAIIILEIIREVLRRFVF